MRALLLTVIASVGLMAGGKLVVPAVIPVVVIPEKECKRCPRCPSKAQQVPLPVPVPTVDESK